MDTQAPPAAGADLVRDESIIGRLRVEVPGFRLISILGHGGQASVYQAIELATGNTIALKILHGGPLADAATRLRFEREIFTLKALNHPNIVRYLGSGETVGGHDYLVMNYIDGKRLDEYLALTNKEQPPSDKEAITLFAQICRAVGAAHRSGITHRDLSPSNIRVDSAGRPHILDFGLARSAFDGFLSPGQEQLTATRQFMGKISYASPEQVRGGREEIDIRSDVYSLGVILYQILTHGQFPYDVSSFPEVFDYIMHRKPLPLGARAAPRSHPHATKVTAAGPPRHVNPTLEKIVLKALEKNPAKRHGSASELAQEIEDALPQLSATPAANSPRWRLPLPDRRAAALVVAATCLAVAAAVIVGIYPRAAARRLCL